jgi:hypothetical protein
MNKQTSSNPPFTHGCRRLLGVTRRSSPFLRPVSITYHSTVANACSMTVTWMAAAMASAQTMAKHTFCIFRFCQKLEIEGLLRGLNREHCNPVYNRAKYCLPLLIILTCCLALYYMSRSILNGPHWMLYSRPLRVREVFRQIRKATWRGQYGSYQINSTWVGEYRKDIIITSYPG